MTRNRATAVVAAALLALGLAAYAVAAGRVGAVASYTGCLKNGRIESVAVGDAPAAPCAAGQTQVRLSGGDVTSVGAGTGLTGGGGGGDLTLAIDPSVVQSRVTGGCGGAQPDPIDASITAIHQDGTVTCNPDDVAAGTAVIAGFHNGPLIPIPPNQPTPSPPTIAELALPAGKYAITATLTLVHGGAPNTLVGCELLAGADVDRTGVRFANVPSGFEARLALQVVHEFGRPSVAEIHCGKNTQADEWAGFLKIVATRVESLTNGPLMLP